MLLVGADPELFLKQDGSFVSAFNVIPGTKEEPYPVNGGAIQVDGMALEFNIEPASSSQVFSRTVNTVMEELRKHVPSEMEIVISSVAEFDKEYIEQQPDKATELGCDPDFSAYSMEQNTAPDAASTIRTAAGHLHLGWTENEDPFSNAHFSSAAEMAKQLDFVLGTPLSWLDTDKRRTSMYGKAGSFRPKPYGMEYRVPSNIWLSSTGYMDSVWRRAFQGYSDLIGGRKYFDMFGDIAQRAINDGDRDAVETIFRELRCQI